MEPRNKYLEWLYDNIKPDLGHSAKKRAMQILSLLNTNGEIDIKQLKKYTFEGIPDEIKGLRSLLWKILLNYLPTDVSEWTSVLTARRSNYAHFKQIMLEVSNSAASSEIPASQSDHDVWYDIDKDIRRTRSDMHFFFTPSTLTYNDILIGYIPPRPYTKPYITGFAEQWSSTPEDLYTQILNENENIEKHADVLARILYIYARLNPGIKYVQGMNEILVPIYYCFSMDYHPDFAPHAEADSFYCFTTLMSEIRDNFLTSMDRTIAGLKGQLSFLTDLIVKHCPDVFNSLDRMAIQPHFYAMRWITLLLTQEFPMPEVLRLWDTLLSDSKRFKYLFYVCLAKITSVRDEVVKEDFSDALTALQHGSSCNLEELLHIAMCYWLVDYDELV
jgi:hypothetical protein